MMRPMRLQSLKRLCLTVYEKMHLHENNLFGFDLDLGAKITQYIAQYSLHNVTYLDTKFEVAASGG